MRCRAAHYWAAALFGLGLAATTGCLSLGGTTTHVHEDPDMKSRVRSLESRVEVLEAALHGAAVEETSASAP